MEFSIQVCRCKRVVSALLLAQSSGERCLLSTMLYHIISLYIDTLTDVNDEAAVYLTHLGDEWSEDLDEELEKLWDLHSVLTNFIATSLEEVLEPFKNVTGSTIHFWIAMMVDPRLKKLKILRRLEAANPSFHINGSLLHVEEEYLMKLLQGSYLSLHPSENIEVERNDSEDDFTIYTTRRRSRRHNQVERLVMEEYLAFRSASALDMDHCPLLYYKTMKGRFPSVCQLAKVIHSIPASQCNVERKFSIAGHIHNQRRNR